MLPSLFLSFSCLLSAQSAHPDCQGAFMVCNKSTIVVNSMAASSEHPHEVGLTSCYAQPFPETHSAWLRWQIDKPGALSFTLLPAHAGDDLDFVLYRMDEKNGCASKTELRCMASGENRGEADASSSEPCTGATGLNPGSSDVAESPGCRDAHDNFLAEVQAEAGEWFLLFVSNHHSRSGFLLEFSGNATFRAVPGDCAPESPPNTLSDLKTPGLAFGTAFPNPATSELLLPVDSPQAMSASLQVIDQSGNLRSVQAAPVAAGQQQLRLSIAELPIGTYFLKVTMGENAHLVKFNKF